MILCNNYSRSNLPQSLSAKDKLHTWAEYLYIHLSPALFPSPEQQRYEQQMMQAAEDSAHDLWQTFKTFNLDPIRWGNQWVKQETLRVYEELEKAGEAAHRIWMQINQPDRAPPRAPVTKLNPHSSEFLFIPRNPPPVKKLTELKAPDKPMAKENKSENSITSKSSDESLSSTKEPYTASHSSVSTSPPSLKVVSADVNLNQSQSHTKDKLQSDKGLASPELGRDAFNMQQASIEKPLIEVATGFGDKDSSVAVHNQSRGKELTTTDIPTLKSQPEQASPQAKSIELGTGTSSNSEQVSRFPRCS